MSKWLIVTFKAKKMTQLHSDDEKKLGAEKISLEYTGCIKKIFRGYGAAAFWTLISEIVHLLITG